jgi:hypothetical protein
MDRQKQKTMDIQQPPHVAASDPAKLGDSLDPDIEPIPNGKPHNKQHGPKQKQGTLPQAVQHQAHAEPSRLTFPGPRLGELNRGEGFL